MPRSLWLAACCLAIASGCDRPPQGKPPTPPPVASTETPSPAEEPEPAADPPSDAEPAVVAGAPTEESAREPAEGFVTLELEGITFHAPASWKRVTPQNRIIEAEFDLSESADDQYDGRLTLMASGGDPQESIRNRSTEFVLEPGSPHVEPLLVSGAEATFVDYQGEWKGPTFRPLEPGPRPGYRMLLAIIPFTPRSAFYAKLVGPNETIAAREAEFREFIASAKITLPKRD